MCSSTYQSPQTTFPTKASPPPPPPPPTPQSTQTHHHHHHNPTPSQIFHELKALFNLSSPIALTALIIYTRSILSMLFLGHLGDTELAAGSLAIAFANITGYSVLAGLALGMEPLCTQAFGANCRKLVSLTLHRTVIFLLLISIPIGFLWIYSSPILISFHQDAKITRLAHEYLVFSLPDLVSNSFLHPTRIYLRAQSVTYPLALGSLFALTVQLPLNYMFIFHLGLGVAGVATASSFSSFIGLVVLVVYVWWAGLHLPTWANPSIECLTGWRPLIRLAIPSCVSVCLEWCWYEIMIILCGLLVDPKAAVASMGVLIQTTAFLYVFPSSLGFAVSTRVGNELGANRPDKAHIVASVSICVSGLMGLSAIVFATSMRHVWAQMFTKNTDIRRLTSSALPISGLCELGNCIQTIGCGVVRGIARPVAAAKVNFGAFYVIGMPIAVGLMFGLGVRFIGVWLGLLAAQVCCASMMLYVVGSINWDEEATKAQMITCKEDGNGETTLDSSYNRVANVIIE